MISTIPQDKTSILNHRIENDKNLCWLFMVLDNQKDFKTIRERLKNTGLCAYYYNGYPVVYTTAEKNKFKVLVKLRHTHAPHIEIVRFASDSVFMWCRPRL